MASCVLTLDSDNYVFSDLDDRKEIFMANQTIYFETLPDGRSFLPPGTILDLSGNGGRYKITGKPIGYGGSGILYPAVTMMKQGGIWVETPLRTAVKECFPAGLPPVYGRVETGEIRNLTQLQEVRGTAATRSEDFPVSPEGKVQKEDIGFSGSSHKDPRSPEGKPLSADNSSSDNSQNTLFSLAQKMLLREGRISGEIFARGFRLTPLLHSTQEEIVILPDRPPALVHNTLGILERLDEKGQPLSQILSHPINGWECFHLFGLILRALAEVHDASYLHGDIQENNIFIKGWEPNPASCELSLVDFGSARRLLKDGATEMIRDRLLFTTKSYAAPECSACNDGTLRLTPAADLYSAGILLLRMLNGRLPEQRSLALTIGGRYLLLRRAKQIGIPSGTVPKINELLTGLLEQEPSQRYQSAREVLEISERIEQALAPRTSALEAIDYDAFISYCHEEPASYVAKQIQQMLERYHIPKTLSRPDGKLTMGRVFLDRTELTAGTDMENHLRSVLSHSAYLIVILSPGVMNSPWVEREISMFLETHGHDQVLTVLAEGEPEEVTPAILREVEKDVNGVMKKTPVESLAADVRGSSRREHSRKLRTEIYRLLAPMLGCGYDDLVMRQKAYRQQRMLRILTAAFLITTAVLSVIAAQALTIRRNYKEALKRESVNLAQRSLDALAEGDRQNAVALALQALPDPGTRSDKPVTVQAKAALIRAMGYYQGADQSITALMPCSLLQMNYPALGIGSSQDGLEQINDTETCLASADRHHSVYAWSIPDGRLLKMWNQEQILAVCRSGTAAGERTFDGTGRILCLAFSEDSRILIITDGAVLEGDPLTGALRLKCTFPQVYLSEKILYLQKQGAFIVCRSRPDSYSEEASLIFDMLDINTGEVLSQLIVSDELGTEASMFPSFDRILSASGGSAAAIVLSNGAIYGRKSCLLIWSAAEHKTIRADIEDTGIFHVDSVSEDAITVLTSNSPLMSLPAGEQRDARLSLIHTQSGTRIWSTDISCSLIDTKAEAQVFSMNGEPYLLFWSGSQVFLLSTDGDILLSEGVPGQICGASLTPDAHFLICTEDGKVLRFYISQGTVYDPSLQVEMHADAFTYHPNSRTAWIFDRTSGKTIVLRPEEDSRCQVLNMSGSSKFGITVSDSDIALFRNDDAGITTVSIYGRKISAKANEIQNEGFPTVLSDDPTLQWTCEGFLNASFCAYDTIFLYGESAETGRSLPAKAQQSAEDNLVLTARSVQSGEILWQRSLLSLSGRWSDLAISGNSKILLCKLQNGFTLLDLQTGEEILSRTGDDFARDNGIPEEIFVYMQDPCISADGKTVLVLTGQAGVSDALSLAAFDVENMSWIELPAELTDFPVRMPTSEDPAECLYISDSGTYAVLCSEEERCAITIDTKDWSVMARIPLAASYDRALSFAAEDRFLIVWEKDDVVRILDPTSGKLLSETQERFAIVSRILYDPISQILTLQHPDGTRSVYYLSSDGQTALIRSYIPGSFSHGLFASIDREREELRIYPVRSLMEMTQEAMLQ